MNLGELTISEPVLRAASYIHIGFHTPASKRVREQSTLNLILECHRAAEEYVTAHYEWKNGRLIPKAA